MSATFFAALLPPEARNLNVAADKRAYRLMLTIRRFEEKLGQLAALGVVPQTPPFVIGKESIAAAIAVAARDDEPMISAESPHAALLARGVGAQDLFGRLIDGRGLETYDASRDVIVESRANFGLAKALERGSAQGAVFCWLSSVLAHNGSNSELLHRVATEKLPIVCIIDLPDANGLAGQDAVASLAQNAGVTTTLHVDGADAGQVIFAVQMAADRARAAEGPTLIAVRTRAFDGHATPATRRGTKVPLQQDTDPVSRARARLILDGSASESELRVLEKDVRESINTAAAGARAAVLRMRDAV